MHFLAIESLIVPFGQSITKMVSGSLFGQIPSASQPKAAVAVVVVAAVVVVVVIVIVVLIVVVVVVVS